MNGACPSAPEFAAQARHLAPGHYYTRGPAAPKPLSDPAATNLFCHCHQTFMSFATQSPAAACRSTDADFCTSRLYHRPGFSTQKAPHHPQNITPPHQAIGSIRFPRRISLPEVFSSGSVRFPRRISLPGMKSFPSASVMTGGLAGPSTRCAHDRPALPDPVGHAGHGQNAVWKG